MYHYSSEEKFVMLWVWSSLEKISFFISLPVWLSQLFYEPSNAGLWFDIANLKCCFFACEHFPAIICQYIPCLFQHFDVQQSTLKTIHKGSSVSTTKHFKKEYHMLFKTIAFNTHHFFGCFDVKQIVCKYGQIIWGIITIQKTLYSPLFVLRFKAKY